MCGGCAYRRDRKNTEQSIWYELFFFILQYKTEVERMQLPGANKINRKVKDNQLEFRFDMIYYDINDVTGYRELLDQVVNCLFCEKKKLLNSFVIDGCVTTYCDVIVYV